MWLNNEQLARSSISAYEPSETITALMNLNNIRDNVNYADMMIEEGLYELPRIEVNDDIKRKNIVLPREQIRRNPEPTVLRETAKYYLWSLFKKYNRGTPFYLSSLLTEHNLTLIHLLDRIAKEICDSQVAIFEGDNSYPTILGKLMRICDYTISTDFDANRHEVLSKVRRALEKNGYFIRAKTKAVTP